MKFVVCLLVLMSCAKSFGQQIREVIELDLGNCWISASETNWKLSSEPDDITRSYQKDELFSEIRKSLSDRLNTSPQEIKLLATNVHCSSIGAKFLFQFKFKDFDGLALAKPIAGKSFSLEIFGQIPTKNHTDGFILGQILTAPNGNCSHHETLQEIHQALPEAVEKIGTDYKIQLYSKFQTQTYQLYKILNQSTNARRCLKNTELNWFLLPAGEYFELP